MDDGWLVGIRIFDALPLAARSALLGLAEQRIVAKGDRLVEAGDRSSHLFVVHSGRLAVRTSSDEIAQLGAREVIGELSLVDERTISADIVAMRPSVVLAIPIGDVREALLAHPEALLEVAGLIADRLRKTSNSDRQPPRVVAVDASSHTTSLVSTLAELHPSSVIATSPDEVAEAESLRTVFVDQSLPGVHADLTLSTRTSTSGLGIRIGEDGPAGGFCVEVDPLDETSLSRLMRFMFGGARVLTLGGGGYRSLATMGLLLEFDEVGLEFDAFIGVSACSPSAVLLGAGRSVPEVVERTMAFGRAISLGRDLGITSTAVTTGKSLTVAARDSCGSLRLEQLPKPVMLGATRLDDRAAVPLVDGPAWKAVRASSSIPVVFPPVEINGSFHVDGGVDDNLPTKFAYERFPNPDVTAVSCSDSTSLVLEGIDTDGIASRNLRSGGSRILDVVTSCLRGNQDRVRADRVIALEVSDANVFGARDFESVVGQGREQARALRSIWDDWRD